MTNDVIAAVKEEPLLSSENKRLQFADIVVYQTAHPENELFTRAAEDLYQTVDEDVRKHIKRITVGVFGEDGRCAPSIVNNKLEINISISQSMKGSRIIGNYNDFTRNYFIETLAHELVHAQSMSNIVTSYGIQEFELIKTDIIAKIGFFGFEEYLACKVVAQKYDSFELIGRQRSIDSIIKSPVGNLGLDKNWSFDLINEMFYEIATRAAFVNVSTEQAKLIETDNQKYIDFITKIRDLLRQFESKTPLNKDQYFFLGNTLITEHYLATTNFDSSVIENKINNLF